MKKSYYFGVAVLGLLITTAVVGITSFAATDNKKPDWPAKRGEMRQMVTDVDYDTWSSTMQERVAEMRQRADEIEGRINQETFNKLQEARQLMQDGDTEGAKAMFEELGLPGHGPRGMGKGFPKGPFPCPRTTDQE